MKPSYVAAVSCALWAWACGTVQQDEPPPVVAPITRSDALPEEPGTQGAPFTPDAERALAARQALGAAGLDFGRRVLIACPGVKPPSFDYEAEKMQASLERSLEELGRCAVAGRLGQSSLRLLVWDPVAGEALRALLVADGVPMSRIQLEPQTSEARARFGVGADAGTVGAAAVDAASDAPAGDVGADGGGGEWTRAPKVRVDLAR